MKKNLKIIALLFLIFSVSACSLGKDENSQQTNAARLAEIKENIANVEKEYKSAVSNILKPYWETQDIAGIKEKILELRAPAEYLSLHFNLVTAFELLEQGQFESDQAKIEEGLEKINKAKEQYSWIK
jgi:folylpolyglutamate synthase/dihydropteroate synthase